MYGGHHSANVPRSTTTRQSAATRLTGKLGRTALVAASATLAITMVTSVLALLTDTVTFQSATAWSNGWDSSVDGGDGGEGGGDSDGGDSEAHMDLRIKEGECFYGEDIYDTAVFSDDTVFNFHPSAEEFDFAAIHAAGSGGGTVDIPPRLCLANAGTGYGSLDVSIIAMNSYEGPDCTNDEDSAEISLGYDGCTGPGGELQYVTELVLREYCAGGDQTDYGAGDWDMWSIGNIDELVTSSRTHSVGNLQPGESCEIDLELWANFPAADDTLAAAMTDHLDLTIAIDLTDATT